MKRLIYILLLCLCNCSIINKLEYATYNEAQKETLIFIYSKIITHGHMEFLKYNDGNYQLIGYSYSIDIRNNKAHCSLRYKEPFDTANLINTKKHWMTSSQLHKPKNVDSYFKCFSDDFLEVSNDRRIEILDSLCAKSNPHSSVQADL